MTQGCDASILLDSGSDGTSELQSGSNLGIRRLDLIDAVKGQLEAECEGTVSCADIIVLAAREAVSFTGGPEIEVPLGRLDGLDASQSAADSSLPAPTITVSRLLNEFGAMGMSVPESVAILGN
jgi:peroxidase